MLIDMYSIDTSFESWLEHQLSRLKFVVVFLRHSRQMAGHYIKLDNECFLLNALKLIIYSCPIIRRYRV
jgi:hypothetical protein